MKNNKLTIIAGPCSIDEQNVREIYQISQIESKGKRAIAGTRIVGLKSRTELDISGSGMGMDYAVYVKNTQILLDGGSVKDCDVLPSAYIAEEIHAKTQMLIATEVMNAFVQLPSYEGKIGKKKLMPWNPAVTQLGWDIETLARFSRKNGWHLGIKNGKWVGDHLHAADTADYKGQTTMEKTWHGLVKYASPLEGDIVLIHRGVDVPGKGNFRSAPVHKIASRVKKASGVKLYFDPSYSYGPKMRDGIPDAIVAAATFKISEEEYLYDGILVEVGTSSTDTDQHITVKELEEVVSRIADFRDFVYPSDSKLVKA